MCRLPYGSSVLALTPLLCLPYLHVLQVDPYVEGGQSLSEPQLLAATSKRGCGVWPAHANYSGNSNTMFSNSVVS